MKEDLIVVNKSNNEVIDKIIKVKETLPKKQKKLCDYIIENYEHISLYTVKELAKAANVGTTTVIRVMKALNYNSFNELRKDLHEASVESGLKTWWHLQKSFTNNSNVSNNTVSQVWEEIIDLLDRTLNKTLIQNFSNAIDLMLNASKINILGLRSSKAVANYFGYLLEEFSPKIKQLSNDSEFLYDRILQMKKDEILFIFVHSPFTVQSIEVAKFCHELGIDIILLTDQLSCPIIPFASVVLKVESSQKQYSIVPTVALIESIVIEYGRKTSDSSIEHLDKLGSLLKKKNITL